MRRSNALRTTTFERILLIKPSALGDVIHTIPVLAKLRKRYPAAQIDWLLTPEIADLVGVHPGVSNVVPFERKKYARLGRNWESCKALGRLIATLRSNKYQLVVDLHGQLRSALLTLITAAPFRVGFDRPRKESHRAYLARVGKKAVRHGWKGAREGAWLAYTHRIPVPTLDVHAVDRYLWIGPLLGLDDGAADFTLPIPDEAQHHVAESLRSRGLANIPFAVLVPGTVWETKHWRPEGFAEVGRHLQRRGFSVVFAGSASESGLCEQIAGACPGSHSFAGRTSVSQFAALISRSQLCVTNDSGSMHLAVALRKPVVSVFGPTDPVWIGPYGRPGSVLQSSIECAPCYLRNLNKCPHDHQCMKDVTAAMVIERVEAVVSGQRSVASGQ